MEGYSYVDIYATKGIEYLLVLALLAAFILFWKFLNVPRLRTAAGFSAAKQPVSAEKLAFDDTVLYTPGHSWAAIGEHGIVSVGLNNFLTSMLGPINKVELPRKGEQVKRGMPLLTIHKGKRRITLPSPFSGIVEASNTKFIENTEWPGATPDSWLVRLKPEKLGNEMSGMRIGARAREWLAGEFNRLRDFFSEHSQQQTGKLGLTLLDGGFPIEGALEYLDDRALSRFAHTFLHPGFPNESDCPACLVVRKN